MKYLKTSEIAELQIAFFNGHWCGHERPRCGVNGRINLQNLMPRKALDMSSA